MLSIECNPVLLPDLEYARWLATKYIPITGSEGDGGAPAGGGTPPGSGEGEGGSGEGGAGEGSAGAGDGAGEGSGGTGEGDGEDDDPDDVLELKRSDYERLRQSAREHDKLVKAQAKKEADDKRKQQIEQGKFEEMLREEAESRLTTEAERDAARDELAAEKRNTRVGNIAKRLGFKNTEDAIMNISSEDGDDDASAERALKKVARNKPYLVDTRRPSGLPLSGNGGPLLTVDAIKNMSADEINANWAEVQKVMAAGGV